MADNFIFKVNLLWQISGYVGTDHVTLVLYSSLAEVNTLSSDDGPLRWVPVVESVIPITIHRKKVKIILILYLHNTLL